MADVEKIPLNIENVLFFEQTSLRKFLKEQKTIQDDLQSEISTSTIKPHLVRSQKIKKQLTIPASEEKLDEDTLRPFSALQSTETIKTFASSYSNIDVHTSHFARLKFPVSQLLDEINGMILHCKIAEIPFPQGLENILDYTWKDFIKDVAYVKRGWPTATCRYACLQRPFSHRLALSKISIQSIISDIDKSRSKTQTPTGEVAAKSARGNSKLFGDTPVKGKKKAKRKQGKVESSTVPHPTGFTINFSISSRASMKQGWIIEPYDDTLAKVDWKTIYALMLEKIQAANSKIKLQSMSMAKHGFNKPVILLHYEEARTVPLGKYWKQALAPVFALKDGKPPIPAMKVENPALNKLHYALNDGSCIIYYPSGNIAVCRSHSGLSCPEAFYTNIFDDSAVRPTLLGSFTPFGDGSIFLPGEKSTILLYHNEGGLLINEHEISMKHWKWPKRGNLPEPIWMHFKRKRSSFHRPVEFIGGTQRANITIQSLRQLHKRIKNIIDSWMEHYRKETGLSKLSQTVEPDLQLQKNSPALDPLNVPAASKKHLPDSASYIRFLTIPAVEKIKCIPRSCTFTSNWPLPISRQESFGVLLANRRGTSTRTTIEHKLQFPKVHKEEEPWLQSPGCCPVNLRSAMLGQGLKPCRCSVVKVPHITDLEFDTFIERATAEIQQIILVCVVSSHLKPMPCESMIEELYKERNRNRGQPCVQSRLDSFRILKYDINTASDHTGQGSALLVERHNVTPGMFLMYIGGKLLFADHIFNGYSTTVKDLKKQLAKTYEDYLTGHHLLHDFRFSSFHYNQSGTELDKRLSISQPDHRERPRSEASILPGTCIFPTSVRAATIQNFIAFSLSQRSGCCSSMLY
ncbi:uncharacterized protein C3orf20-like isoform X2 [Mobula birostris]|uniref:uncharacterized protein C3orf20-like isoform X2 n=1 Tax=Mobula birostris TaxID=1983395 RepID=UPI003B283E25